MCPVEIESSLGFMVDPHLAREFAMATVRQLRAAGYEALWAGGCVRDLLLFKEPKDYDVATSATPMQVRDCLGHRRTLEIGASFGVITVIGPAEAGHIEVATFRRDEAYVDGRRPTSVSYTSSEEDARRRDFTMNGLFYDPIQEQVIDYVGGERDLRAGIVRAIGNPVERFTEDKLRLLRGVRFAATLGFVLEAETANAMRQLAGSLLVVSAERIAAEMRRMLSHPHRADAVRLLQECKLLSVILPETEGWDADVHAAPFQRLLTRLERLPLPAFEPALALILRELLPTRETMASEALVKRVADRWRLSSEELAVTTFCLVNESIVTQAQRLPWPQVQRVLVQPRAESLIAYVQALAADEPPAGTEAGLAFCLQKRGLAPAVLNPKPLVDGADLQKLGLKPGPQFREILEKIRDAQLMGELHTTDEALAWTLRYTGRTD